MTEKENKKDSGAQKPSKKPSDIVKHRAKQEHYKYYKRKHIPVIDTHPPPDGKPKK